MLGENPWSSKAWKEEAVVLAFAGLERVLTDKCRYGLRRPSSEYGHEMDRRLIDAYRSSSGS